MAELVLGPFSDPLGEAFKLFGDEIEAIESSTNVRVMTITMPENNPLIGVYPTGLEGNLSHDHKPSALYNRSNIKFTRGAPWKVRWDYDAGKESHVNVEIGKGPNRLKFAFIAETSSTRDRQGVEPYYSAIKQAQQAVNWNENCRTDSDASRLIAWWSARFHKPRWNVYSTEEPYQ